jgi:cell division control protein 6
MPVFNSMLKDSESLFRDEIALDYEFMPKIIPYRENEQKQIALAIKPLLQKRAGKNIIVHGSPGIGKTAATKQLLRELDYETDEVIPIYINCWKKNTSYKIILEICDLIGYKLTMNKKSDELFKTIIPHLNKKSIVFVFDEIDKLEEIDFLYNIIEDVYRKTIILITNYKSWLLNLDERLKSRLTIEPVFFRQYNRDETFGILKHRLEYAFVPGVLEDDAFNLIAEKASDLKDIRTGLHLLREAGLIAETKASRKITLEYAKEAVQKLDEISVKKSTDLEQETKNILDFIKKNNNQKIGDLYRLYQEQCKGTLSYKSFQRKITKLEEGKFISTVKTEGGSEGNTTIIRYAETKKLTDF